MELDYSARLYAELHHGTPGDVQFYREQCHGQSVLELGSGVGRVLFQVATEAKRAVGLERHPGMLKLAREALYAEAELSPSRERVQLVEGDMSDFDLGERFDRVIIPYSGFWCLLNETSKRNCLQCVRNHLSPGGRLILDLYSTDELIRQALEETGRAEPIVDEETFLVEFDLDGANVRVFEQSTWWPSSNRIDVAYSYHREDEAPHRGLIRQHYLALAELLALIAGVGFAGTTLYELDDFAHLKVVLDPTPGESSLSQWVLFAERPSEGADDE